MNRIIYEKLYHISLVKAIFVLCLLPTLPLHGVNFVALGSFTNSSTIFAKNKLAEYILVQLI